MEERGFDRDEIWYNRERGEELFFDMMNEANDQDEFEMDGPLWIQVHALDKGLEIVVTRGQISDGNVKLEIPVPNHKSELEQSIVDLLSEDQETEEESVQSEQLEIIIGFADLEDVISLSHSFFIDDLETNLYHYEGRYYLHVVFNDESYSENEQDDMLSQMLEFGFESDLSIYRIEEYGKDIISGNALETLRNHF